MTYFLRTLPDIQDLLEPLQNAISQVLIPAIMEHDCRQLDRDILVLPVYLGNPSWEASQEYASSVKMTLLLVEHTTFQTHQLPDKSLVMSAQQTVKSERAEELKDMVDKIRGSALPKTKRALDLAPE